MNSRRRDQLGKQIQEFVATLFVTKIDDPRLKLVTVTRAKASADTRKVTLFFSVLGDDEARAGAEAALQKAKKYLRALIGQELPLRYVPDLRFVYDKNPEYAQKVMELINSAKAEGSWESGELDSDGAEAGAHDSDGAEEGAPDSGDPNSDGPEEGETDRVGPASGGPEGDASSRGAPQGAPLAKA
ncbi:MAG: 30S ribosome-binding factor RbfA [Deltaproteobacteria bacterium]|jgi:ribosome-binding factor A|nr:30S ribosome-binding factor RbfA [Deltaproteobacteria bacterium]